MFWFSSRNTRLKNAGLALGSREIITCPLSAWVSNLWGIDKESILSFNSPLVFSRLLRESVNHFSVRRSIRPLVGLIWLLQRFLRRRSFPRSWMAFCFTAPAQYPPARECGCRAHGLVFNYNCYVLIRKCKQGELLYLMSLIWLTWPDQLAS